MPCFVANCAVVSSPRSASKATFALKSAEYRFRLPTIGSVLTKGRTKLNPLSEFRGPPQFLVRVKRHAEAPKEAAPGKKSLAAPQASGGARRQAHFHVHLL